jgi:hypothetical protein
MVDKGKASESNTSSYYVVDNKDLEQPLVTPIAYRESLYNPFKDKNLN